MINALHGTRMGRKVEDPKRVISQAQEWAKQAGDLETRIGKEPSSVQPLVTSPFGSEDFFKWKTLSICHLSPNDIRFELTGVENRDGDWARLELIYQGGVCQTTQSNHFKIGKGEIVYFAPNDFVKQDIPTPRVAAIAPLKAVYWFLRAAYSMKDYISESHDKKYSVVPALREAFKQSILDGTHFADIINWELAGDRIRPTITIDGWPEHHGFRGCSALSAMNLFCDDIPLTQGGTLISSLTRVLFDDPNPQRVNDVLSWALDIPCVYFRIDGERYGRRAVIFESKNGSVINLFGRPNSIQFETEIMANASDYTPRVRP